MDTFLLLARLFLSGVFLLSAVTKLFDPEGSRRAVIGFGVPERFARAAGVALPLAELLIAILLVPTATAWWGALAALLLLLGFIAGIIVNLRQGRTPECHCFGKLHSEPIGAATLIRDGFFTAVAAVVVLFGWNDPGASSIAWFVELTSWERVLTVAAALLVVGGAVQSWLLVQMMQQNGRLLLRLDTIDQRLTGGNGSPPTPEVAPATAPAGLPVGTPAPAFQLEGLHGEIQTLDALRASGKPVLLIFSSPTCAPCTALMPEIGRWQREYSRHLTIAVIGRGDIAVNRSKSAEHGLSNVLIQQEGEIAALYHADGTPTGVLIDPNGTIAAPPALGSEAIRAVVTQTVTSLAPVRTPIAAGHGSSESHNHAPDNGLHERAAEQPSVPVAPERRQAPPIALPDVDGRPVALSDFAGEPTVVLFWRPGCGYCQQMLPDLKVWESGRSVGDPRLLIVSSESEEANRAQGLASPIVLDSEGFAIGQAYGVGGTPAAVLVDNEGYIVGPAAVGKARVLALLSGEEPVAEAPAAQPNPVSIGDPAPAIILPGLDQQPVSLADFAGQPTVVLFWRPGCVFCQQMSDELRDWETAPPSDAPRLLVVSSGSPEENRALGLQSPLVLESGFTTGRAYGASGTPSAILVDAAGNVASSIAVGRSNVLALLNYVSAGCKDCLATCKQQGGGAACQAVCDMSGQCP